jgi:3-oxoacyl-[acyl-carrier-protein] synthase-3
MNLKFQNKKITGILTIMPEKELKFDDEIENYEFSKAQSMKLKLIMGYNKRRVVEEGTTVSDLCIFGMNHLFDNNLLDKKDIDGLVLVTQSPDQFMPSTAHIIHGKLGLKHDVFCLDINEGCSGYPIGLMNAFMLLEQDEINKVVLLNADVLSRKVSKHDRSSGPLTGDAASITIVEKHPKGNLIFGTINSDGAGADALMIPAGGFKLPSNQETGKLSTDDSGNKRSKDHMVMKGDLVFNFVLREVPPMIKGLLNYTKVDKKDVDFFMLHQPNKFMLQKLAAEIGVSGTKLPNNIVENFGNSASVTIPVNIVHNLGNELTSNSFLICLAGFGTGLSWSSLLMPFGNLQFCKSIVYK